MVRLEKKQPLVPPFLILLVLLLLLLVILLLLPRRRAKRVHAKIKTSVGPHLRLGHVIGLDGDSSHHRKLRPLGPLVLDPG